MAGPSIGRRRPRTLTRSSAARMAAMRAAVTRAAHCGTALAVVAASLLAAPSPAAAAAPADGLLVHYKLDERSGTVAADSSGNGRDGVVAGTADWTPGRGLGFNGTDTHVKAPDDLMAELDSITVATDVLIDPEQSGDYSIYGFGNSADGYLIADGNTSRTSVSIGDDTAEESIRATPKRNPARGTFKHLTYTQAGDTGVLYEDGVEVARNTALTVRPRDLGASRTTANHLGRSLDARGEHFKGRLRDFRVYDRALSAAEVAELGTETTEQGVAADRKALRLGDTSGVTEDLKLPAPSAYGSTITWSSSDPSVLSDTGKVTRPAGGRRDATVTLTATLQRGAARDTKAFTVTVPAKAEEPSADPAATKPKKPDTAKPSADPAATNPKKPDTAKPSADPAATNPDVDRSTVDRAAADLTVPAIDDVRGNLTLPVRGAKGTVVSWRSDRPSVITEDGVVTRPKPGADKARVDLTATVRLGGASASRTFQATVPPLTASQPLKGYLFSYFTGERRADGEQIYAALSRGNNALRFRELNGGRPVLTSTLGDKGLRDPFIIRSPEGDKFYQIATDLRIHGNGNWDAAQRTGSKSIMVWESTDLVNWTDRRLVKVSPDTAGNTWAPEAFYDHALGAYVVFWASKIYAENDPEHRGNTYNKMMYATTRDFVTFTPAKVWNDPGYAVIDSTIVEHDGVYHRFTKDERNRTAASPCGKFVTHQKSRSILDPSYQSVADCVGKGTLGVAEGPSIVKSNIAEKWYLYLDEFDGKGYVPFESTDLNSGRWSPTSGYELPASPRHGTVLPVTQAEYDRLLRRYVPAEVVERLDDVTVRTPVGRAPQLPPLVDATFADGSSRAVAVTWEPIPPAKYATPGVFTVSGVIAESSTVRAKATVTVYAEDAADAGPDTTGTEGAPIKLAGVAQGDGDRGWEYRKLSGVDSGATCTFAAPQKAATIVTCTDDGTYEMKLHAGNVTDTATVTVANARPVIGEVRVPGATEAGRPTTVTAVVSDAGRNDTHTCAVDWRDGTSTAGTVADGICTASHTYAAPGAFEPVVTVTDDDSGSGTAGVRVVVTPARTVDAGPDVTGTEGGAVALRGAASSGTPTWTYRAVSGADRGATCAFADARAAVTTLTCTDDGTYEVTLTEGDRSDRATVTVAGAAPVIVRDAVPATARPGGPVAVRVWFADAGANDTHTCAVNLGDGRVRTGDIVRGVCSTTHTYADAGAYPVDVTVTDDDGRAVTVRRTVAVGVADQADAGPDIKGAEGAAIRLTGTAAGGAPRWAYRPVSGVDAGATCAFADAEAARTTITCTDDGTYEVGLAVGTATDTARVTVTNAAPALSPVLEPDSATTGRRVRIGADFTDAGRHDRHTCTVDWDGARSTGAVAGGACTAGHTYRTAGTYDVRVTVTDDDGASASRTVEVVVRAPGEAGGGPGTDDLPQTGSPVTSMATSGLALLIGGAVLLLMSRRRERA